MPKIRSGSLREHRAQMLGTLVEAAERLLREGGPMALTAGEVAAAAGIARNSLYRYVDSVDDLRSMVVAQYLPEWTEAVRTEVAAEATPHGRLMAYVRANLAQAATSGHGWLMSTGAGLLETDPAGFAALHAELVDSVIADLRELDPAHPALTGRLLRSVLDGGFARLDAGDELVEVTKRCLAMTAALADIAESRGQAQA